MQEVMKLPYGFVYAVASTNSVAIYTTQHSHPVALLGGLHYAPVTDLAWCVAERSSPPLKPLVHTIPCVKPSPITKCCVSLTLQGLLSTMHSSRYMPRILATWQHTEGDCTADTGPSSNHAIPGCATAGVLPYALLPVHRSQDGLLLTISSQDGYCTVVGFQEGELGIPLQIRGKHSSLGHTSPVVMQQHQKESISTYVRGSTDSP